MRYRTLLIFSLAAALGLATPADAAKRGGGAVWVCGGYFEKRLDRIEASYGIRIYRERFLATPSGAVRRAMFVFPVAFRVMRDHLRSQSEARFGEAGFDAFDAFDLSRDVATPPEAAAKQAARAALAPGDQVASLPAGGVRLDTAAAVRIVTKPFNGVPSRNGWSKLTMMVLDGSRIFGVDSTLIVSWRYDSAEQWGTGPSGSLFDFGKHRYGDTFVTSTEFGLMERLKKLYATPFTVVPLSAEGPLAKDAARLDRVRGWLRRYKDDPEDETLQAKKPGGC
jgi:hypothetical protein